MKIFFALLLACGSALADDGALLRCRETADSASRLACYDAIAVQPTAARGAASTASIDPATARKSLEQSFGIEFNKKFVLDSIESTIPGTFRGWGPKQRIRLANGQLWAVVDDSEGVMTEIVNPKVVITRGMLGALFMEIEGTRQAPRVHRIQ